jgi:hypothetical protein
LCQFQKNINRKKLRWLYFSSEFRAIERLDPYRVHFSWKKYWLKYIVEYIFRSSKLFVFVIVINREFFPSWPNNIKEYSLLGLPPCGRARVIKFKLFLFFFTCIKSAKSELLIALLRNNKFTALTNQRTPRITITPGRRLVPKKYIPFCHFWKIIS